MPIIVNGVEITDDEVHAEMQYHPAPSVEAARHKAAQTLVIKQLLIQEAARKELLDPSKSDSTKEAERAIDSLIQQELSIPEADEESCERYYEQNKERFKDKKTGSIIPFENVLPYIRDYLQARSLQTGINQYIQVLSGKAKIAGFSLEGSESPLVQ